MLKHLEAKLINKFKERESFTREELQEFYRHFDPDLKEGTFGWRIYDLKNKKIIRSLGRGRYVIAHKPKYTPEISLDLINVARRTENTFKDSKYCVWETNWLSEFALHQSGKRMIFIEIEKDLVKPLFYELKEFSAHDTYLNPKDQSIELYVSESYYPIIIKNLISRSPLDKIKYENIEIHTPSLEKILVDLFSDTTLFYYLQGSDLTYVFENAIRNYAVNFTKMFSYASRRGKEEDLKEFMLYELPHIVKDLWE